MSNLNFKCEATDPNVQHVEGYFFCAMCNIVICTSCMIKHLCVIHHPDHNVVQPVQVVITKSKNVTEMMEKKIKKGYEELSKVNVNEADVIVSKKRKEINDHFEMLLSQLRNVKNAIEIIFDKQIAEFNEGKANLASKKINPSLTNEYNLLVKAISELNQKLNGISTDGNSLLKEFTSMTNNVENFMLKIEGEKKSDRNVMAYSRKISMLTNTLDNLDVGSLFSELKRYIDRNQIQLNVTNTVNTNPKENIDTTKKTPPTVINKQSNNIPISTHPKIHSVLTQKDSELYDQIQKINKNLKGNPQSTPQILNDPNFVYPYKGIYLINLRLPDGKNKSEIMVYNPITRTNSPAELKVRPKDITGSYEHFPYRNCKYTNIGNNTIIITGGYIDSTISNKVFALKVNKDLSTELIVLKSLKTARQSHNIIYISQKNQIIVCGGQNNKSSEILNLANPTNLWEELPDMNKPRANATMFYLNNVLYCIGGYNHQSEKYQSGYEMLDLTDLSKGWKEIILDDLSMSTMGVVILNNHQVMLLGGFKGGKKYLNDGLIITIDEKTKEIINIDKRANVMTKGGIFYCSQQFIQCEDTLINIDFKGNTFLFNRDKLSATIEIVNNI